MKSRVIIAAVLVAGACSAAQPLIDGWNGVPWGTSEAMTLRMLSRMHPQKCHPPKTNDDYDKYACPSNDDNDPSRKVDSASIDDYAVDSMMFSVTIYFQAQKLVSVMLLSEDDSSETPEAAQAIRSLLTEKYGKSSEPEISDYAYEVKAKWRWLGKSGTIVLEYHGGKGSRPVNQLSITYDKRSGPNPL